MKVPQNKKELATWPLLGLAVAFILMSTAHLTFPQYQILLCEYEGAPFYVGYLFPVVMGILLAWRLHSKFWLDFAWMGVTFYLVALLLTLLPQSTLIQNMFMVSMCIAILQGVQSSCLKIKNWMAVKNQPA